MELSLERPLLFFDIESTGLNIALDGIVELSFVKVFPNNHQEIKTWRIRPWDYAGRKQIPMNPEASALTGIKDEDLVGEPRFIERACEIVSWIVGSDLAGFNSSNFDLPLLAEEFERVRKYCEERIAATGVPDEKKAQARKVLEACDIDLHACRMVDVKDIYHYMEPRNLRAAYRFYCGGKDFENAHSAEADTLATYEVLKAQLDRYREPDAYHEQALQNDVQSLSSIGFHANTVDFAGRIILRDGVPTISFGKHRDKSVREIFEKERSYFAWIEQGDFPLDTKRQFRKLKEQYEAESKAAKAAKEASDSAPLEGEALFDSVEKLRKHFGK